MGERSRRIVEMAKQQFNKETCSTETSGINEHSNCDNIVEEQGTTIQINNIPHLIQLAAMIESDVDDDIDDPDFIPSDESSSIEDTLEPKSKVQDAENNENYELINEQPEQTVKRKRSKRPVPEEWTCNKRKICRQSGKSYYSRKGKLVPERTVKFKDCSRCPRKCNEKFPEEERKKINKKYWEISDIEKQRQFLSLLVVEKKKQSTRTDVNISRQSNSIYYFFIKNNEKVSVCKGFFLKTLDISESTVRTVLKKVDDHCIVARDERGRKPPAVKICDESREYIKQHINSFPKVPAHYCRKDSKKKYLSHELNIQKMYELYCAACESDGLQPEKISFYRHIFKTEFNLSFHTPRKDLCDLCYKFEAMTEKEKEETRLFYENHEKQKLSARKFKDDSKVGAESGLFHFYEFDMEAVRYCPHTNAKKMFYKRRLAVYNLTLYNVGTKCASNYMWPETVAKRGSVEIASSVYDLLSREADGKEFIFMSDNCSGQNRNINMSAMFLYAVKTLDIPIITHSFFTPGHSFMECDSVHARIEKASKNVDIFDPSGWYTLVRMASKGKKYSVIEMGQQNFLNFTKIQKSLIQNRKVDEQGEVMHWLKIVSFQYRKDSPEILYFKYAFEEEYRRIKVLHRKGSRKSCNTPTLERAYSSGLLPISAGKLKDLLELCETGIIPEQYHCFYKGIKGNNSNDNSSDESDEN